MFSTSSFKSWFPCFDLDTNFYFVQKRKEKLKWNVNTNSPFTFICFLLSPVLSSLDESKQVKRPKSQSKKYSVYKLTLEAFFSSWMHLFFSCPYCVCTNYNAIITMIVQKVRRLWWESLVWVCSLVWEVAPLPSSLYLLTFVHRGCCICSLSS